MTKVPSLPRQLVARSSHLPRLPRTFLPATPLLALLTFLAGSAPNAPAATPAPGTTSGLTPEAQKESDWVDARWNKTEVGPFLASNLSLPGSRIAKGLSIKVGAKSEGTMAYDTATAAWRAAWLGGFLRFDAGRYGLIQAPAPGGRPVAQAGAPTQGTLGVQYRALHLHGARVALESTVGGTRMIESPWLIQHEGQPVFTRALRFDPAPHAIRVALATIEPGAAPVIPAAGPDGIREFTAPTGTNALRFRVSAPGPIHVEGRLLILEVPSGTEPRRAWIAMGNAARPLTSLPAPEAPDAFTQPGPARWLPTLETRGQRGLDLDFLSIDTLTAPYDNPWKALLFFAGIDFTPDGAAYACTIHGDVWKITGIDDPLQTLRWHRFATGLFQPLGLKVRNGLVHVLGRDQITRLRDGNGDHEADTYEVFNNQIQTSTGGHDYVTCLEQDSAGNFYYVDPRGLHRVSPDGAKLETVATGWRNPNGMGVSPDGRFLTVAPQQGDWTPSSQISLAKPGGYYGYAGPKVSPDRPLGYDAPLCWIPHRVDNSSGSQVWVPPGTWGPLGGQMLHLLWGRCTLMLVLRDQVGDVHQGGVVPLPGKLLAGPNRGSFHPADGHLYVAGSTGWQTAAARDGALQRIRFNAAKPAAVPSGFHVHSNGLAVTFSVPIDRAAAEDTGSYGLHQWNYRYSSTYGSKEWSVADPNREGHDELPIQSARLLADGRTVFLQVPGLAPVMQMELKYSLNSAAGRALRSQFWFTVNALDAARPASP